MIDQIRDDIEQRLEEVLAEADKLRRALSALGSSDGSGGARSRPRAASTTRSARPGGTRSAGRSARRSSATASSRQRTTRARAAATAAGSGGRTRTASGATRAAVLEALANANGEALTAGQVATATGLGRPSVSTTLSKLARSGDVNKAARGYAISK